jgi:DNA-binding IclR family transcriptional regulator
MNADAGGASSLERMLAILALFTEHKLEWTSEELMSELGYSRPTLYRYLKSLRTNGMLASTNNASFTLGPKVVEMDFLLRRSDPLVIYGRGYLEEIASKFPGTAFLSRWYGNKVLCVESVCSANTPVSSYPRGRPMPVGRGATSRAILAFLPRRQAEDLIEARMGDFQQIGFGDTTEDVLKGLSEIRRQGVAIAKGEVTDGVLGMAAPVFDASRIPIASLSLTLADDRMTPEVTKRAADNVREAAVQLSMKLADRRQATGL